MRKYKLMMCVHRRKTVFRFGFLQGKTQTTDEVDTIKKVNVQAARGLSLLDV